MSIYNEIRHINNNRPNIVEMELSPRKKTVEKFMDLVAPERDRWIRRNTCYYNDLIKTLNFNIPEGSSILEIGCGTGYLLGSLKPKDGAGIDLSYEMIRIAKEKYPQYKFYQMDAESLKIERKYDFVIISDTLGYFEDVQKVFSELHKVVHEDSRLIITLHSQFWMPMLSMAEWLKMKMPSSKLNWLNIGDITNLLQISGFEVIKTTKRVLCPKNVPLIASLTNKFLSQLPIINNLCFTNYIVARKQSVLPANNGLFSVSVIIPARNEKGNIENAIKRMPFMGKSTEVIFVEGNSNDGTLDEIKRVCNDYSHLWDIKYCLQDGVGKGDAVRKGFNQAKGDILMILDADLTVPPEDLSKFYNAIATGKGEYINGSRLVYPMEKEAMKILNMMANTFFSWMFSWLINQRLKDTLCGTKVLSKKNYEKIVSNRKYFGEFDPFGDFDLIFGSAKLNLKIVEVPIRYRARQYGETNISRFKHGWLLLKMVFFALNKIKFI